MTTPKSPRYNQAREEITESLNCGWSDVEFQFRGESLDEIKAELDKMFRSDANGELATKIHSELGLE